MTNCLGAMQLEPSFIVVARHHFAFVAAHTLIAPGIVRTVGIGHPGNVAHSAGLHFGKPPPGWDVFIGDHGAMAEDAVQSRSINHVPFMAEVNDRFGVRPQLYIGGPIVSGHMTDVAHLFGWQQ